ncbi:hypothetical protein BTN49_0758 [Candidatus Enterovibrio escicola]|uniref:Uncharacterized protein n=1 Tax=Candidatus Enterovibrio escicola TaxID=1927127 RepID=A0A2A5T6F6_9GAMM|nr:hypothetical protein BTN49_0758 [Candidatus Enterovibrio escacola]
MCHAEAIGLAIQISGNALFSSFYLNKLLIPVVKKETAYY